MYIRESVPIGNLPYLEHREFGERLRDSRSIRRQKRLASGAANGTAEDPWGLEGKSETGLAPASSRTRWVGPLRAGVAHLQTKAPNTSVSLGIGKDSVTVEDISHVPAAAGA